jgi:hypothetical protein
MATYFAQPVEVKPGKIAGDFDVIHPNSGGTVATKFNRGDAEALAAELNSPVVPFEHGCGYCMTCGYGGEPSRDCLHPPNADSELQHLRNEAVRLRIQGAVV